MSLIVTAIRPSRGSLRILSGITALGLALCLSAACGGSRGGPGEPAAELLSKGEDYLERGKYRNAQDVFQELLDRYPSDPAADRAQLGLARSAIGLRNWEIAREELRVMLDRYTGSPLVEDARYYLGIAYARESLPPELDQELTWRALEEFEAYRADYPSGRYSREIEEEVVLLRDKLAEKEYLNGRLYLRLGFADAARIYFEGIIEEYGDTAVAPRGRLGLAEALSALGRTEDAEEIYRDLLGTAIDPDLREDCERRLRKLGESGDGSPQG